MSNGAGSGASAISPVVRYGLYALAFGSVVIALIHGVYPKYFDQTTAIFLALAAVILVVPEIGKFEFMGVKLERFKQEMERKVETVGKVLDERVAGVDEKLTQEVNQSKAELRHVDQKVEFMQDRGLFPGRKPRNADGPDVSFGLSHDAEETRRSDPNDPNKWKFGGQAEDATRHRVLRATITPALDDNSPACEVELWVESTDPVGHPLEGEVEFHLHPSFGEWKSYRVAAKHGRAKDRITSWGAFTVGAVADGGQTKLELDLMDVEGGTTKFYQN